MEEIIEEGEIKGAIDFGIKAANRNNFKANGKFSLQNNE